MKQNKCAFANELITILTWALESFFCELHIKCQITQKKPLLKSFGNI